MAPVKFDDISKTANDVLSDDFQTSGYQCKNKLKTYNNSVVTITSDLEDNRSFTKLSLKTSTPFNQIDKLEIDKSGKVKLEMSSDKIVSGAKMELKPNLLELSKSVASITYTGLADTRFQIEHKVLEPQKSTVEVTRALGDVTIGAKVAEGNFANVDVGARFASGTLFASVYARQQFSVFTAHGFYKISDVSQCALTYEHGGKKNGQFSVGFAHNVTKDATLKAKFTHDNAVHVAIKQVHSKGFTTTGGARYNLKSGDVTYGFQLSME